jgi:hypothetical protein
MARPSIPAREVRPRLIRDCRDFILTARRLSGVARIALVGSITSPKEVPKDIDVLVTVTDIADLAPLAQAGRRLKGHTQSYNLGADVFLANTIPRYIGRICSWKDCRPGLRASCDARHCGRRPFLHDDLDCVSLPDCLVSAPPIELWPQFRCRVTIPEDVQRLLLSPLAASSHPGQDNAA